MLSLPVAAGHVRTARLVAVAVARRLGLDGGRLEEVRIAVGEACTRAVRRCAAPADDARITVSMGDPDGHLVVWVTGPVTGPSPGPDHDDEIALALLRGLVPEVVLIPDAARGTERIRMSWPA